MGPFGGGEVALDEGNAPGGGVVPVGRVVAEAEDKDVTALGGGVRGLVVCVWGEGGRLGRVPRRVRGEGDKRHKPPHTTAHLRNFAANELNLLQTHLHPWRRHDAPEVLQCRGQLWVVGLDGGAGRDEEEDEDDEGGQEQLAGAAHLADVALRVDVHGAEGKEGVRKVSG